MGSVRGGVRANEFGAFFDSITADDRAIYAPIMDAVLSLLGNGAPGVVSDLLSELEVSPVTPAANSILIAAGSALMGASGAHVFALTEELTFAVPAAAAGNSRIDRIGVRLDGRSSSPDNREITIARIGGIEASSNPAVPAITDAQDDVRFFFDLAHVTINGVDSITAADVADRRTFRGSLALSDDVPEDVSADAATAGTGADASRETHGHQVETGDPVDVGTANDAGSGSELALANHGHNVPTGLRGVSANSPAFTGTPTTPDAPSGANTQQIANARWVRARLADLIASAPGTLDTLNELAAALDDDPNFAATIAASVALKAGLASPAFTGTPTTPDAPAAANTQQIANARWVRARIGGFSPITKYRYAMGDGTEQMSPDTFNADDLLLIGALDGPDTYSTVSIRFGDMVDASIHDTALATVEGHKLVRIWRSTAGNLLWDPQGTPATGSYIYVTRIGGAFI